MMRRTVVFAAVVGVLALAAACASRPAELPSGTVAEDAVVLTASVEKVDLAKRLVTLKGPQGNVATFQVDERVKNLPQLRAGDMVVVGYYESVAFQVRKPGEGSPGTVVAADATAAEPGEKPGLEGRQVVTVTTTIQEIDKKAPSVTLRGADGGLVTVKVKDPKKLDQVRVGDLVEIAYTQALAISVDPAPAK